MIQQNIDADIPNYYRQQVETISQTLRTVNQKRQRIAWQRLLIVLITFAAVYQTWPIVPAWAIALQIVAGIALFLYVVSKDTDAKNEALNLQRLLEVNEKEISILNGHFDQYESGEAYLPPHHVYAQDLDILGNSSLYQYINRCTSQQGKQLLASRMLAPLPKPGVEREQEAIQELKGKTAFRQQLAASGAANPLRLATQQKLEKWVAGEMPYTQKKWDWLTLLYPVFTFGILALYMADVMVSGIFYALIFLCFLFAFSLSKKISPVYDALSDAANETETFYQQLQLIERESCSSKKLSTLQQQLKSENGNAASVEIVKLHAILNRFNVRLNTFAFYFVNTFLLWDLRQLRALIAWKQENASHLPVWFPAIAEWEVSSSLATLAFNQPAWCVPIISNDYFLLEGTEIGHPLLPKQNRVNNSFRLQGTGKVAVITGSNMGGKSTFLRSLGMNIVLALMGAPVCAQTFSVSATQLMSSMRIADNLAENTSTFYAELKKLKTIIEAVNRKEQVFILLDEILRGTNSFDRHTGSVALLRQLIQHNAVAVIATHDVELAKLEEEHRDAITQLSFRCTGRRQ